MKGIYWFMVWPKELDPERILARRRVLSSVPLFLMTLTTGAPPAGEPLRRSQMLPAAAVLADRSGKSWMKGFLACARRPRPSKLEVLIAALSWAVGEGLISWEEGLGAVAELRTMKELQSPSGEQERPPEGS